MNQSLEMIFRIVLVGIGGTAAMDLWRLFLQRAFAVQSLDLGLLGRWVGSLGRGKFFHDSIAKSPPVKGELALGWLSHYAIGISFAGVLAFVFPGWLSSPALLPALAIGVGTVLAPWLVLQPAMGLGLAASRSSDPRAVRMRNLAIHTVYGLGVFISGAALQELLPAARQYLFK